MTAGRIRPAARPLSGQWAVALVLALAVALVLSLFGSSSASRRGRRPTAFRARYVVARPGDFARAFPETLVQPIPDEFLGKESAPCAPSGQ